MAKKKKQNFVSRFIKKIDNIHIGIGKEREYFVENLSMLVGSGMPIVSGVSVLEDGVRSRSMKKILAAFKEDIENGTALWKAFHNTHIFSEHTISLIKVGEESGRLSENLKLISEQETKDRSFRSKIRSAMMYPVFVLTLTVVLGVSIAWFILPRLATVFEQMQIELPLLTQLLISGGKFLGEYGYIVIPAFFFTLVSIIYFVFYFSKTKFIGQSLLFSLPGIKRLIQEVELTRFGYILGTLLQAGLPITRALDSLHSSAQFPHYKKFYAYLNESINEGNSFIKSFVLYKKTNRLIPSPIQQLIAAGEQSGNLAETLVNISVNYEEKTENTTKNLAVIVEPILLVIVWLGVVSVALGVILPIYNLTGGLSSGQPQIIPTEQVVTEVSRTSPIDPEENMETPTGTSTTDVVFASTTPIIFELKTSSTSTLKALSTILISDIEFLEENIESVTTITTLRILSTGLEYLNVRMTPSTQGKIIGQVFPDKIYPYTNIRDGWYEIIFNESQNGWVAGKYITTIKNDE